jgi:outer membrane protein TolC
VSGFISRVIFSALLLVIFAAPSARSADEPEPVIILNDLIAEAGRANPEILTLRHSASTLSYKAGRLGSWPQPRLSFVIRNVGFDGLTIGEEMMSSMGIMASQDIPFPGKLGLREETQQIEAGKASEMLRSTELKVIAQVKQSYYQLYYIYRSLETLQKRKQLLEDAAEIATARYEVGTGIQHDLLLAQLEISKAIEESLKLEEQKAAVKTELSTLLNRSPNASIGGPVDKLKAPQIQHTLQEILELALSNSPAIEASRLNLEKAGSMYSLAKMEYLPDFQLSAGYMSRGEFDDIWEVRFGMKLPLYFWGKPRHGVMETKEMNLSADEAVQVTEQKVLEKTTILWQQIQTATRLVSLYEEAMMPQANTSFESALSSYMVGKTDFATLVASVVSLLKYELEYHRQLAELNKRVALLEETVGVELTDSLHTGGTN